MAEPDDRDRVANAPTLVPEAPAPVDSLDREASLDSLSDVVSAPAMRPPPARGAELGRYLVLDKIGEGGLGVVLSAYDPQLDRKVAIKLLRRDAHPAAASTRANERSLREARALARVVHPNIVAVHDAGLVDGELYVVMELVDGADLRQWLAAAPRALDAILDAFVQAGEGLAAAHAAGLIHRDFKPANVLVGGDGRVRVADFGLARVLDAPAGMDSLDGAVAADVSDAPAGRVEHTVSARDTRPSAVRPGAAAPARGELTVTGAFVGTPAYMAPEQLDGATVDERADVFAYCVSLWEAAYGAPPFDGATLGARRRAIAAGPRGPAPGRDVPAWLRELLVAGLAERPADRPAGMRAILDVIARRRRGARAPAIAAAAAALGGVAVLGAVLATRGGAPSPCGTSAAELAPAWGPARVAAVERAVAATGGATAAAWPAVRARLDAYAGAWIRGHRAACQATRVAGTQSEAVLDRRMACLGRAAAQLGAVAGFLERGGADAAAHADDALALLPALDDCARGERLGPAYAMPADPALTAEVHALQAEVAAIRVSALDERLAQAEDADRALTRARALGWTPLIVDAAAARGQVAEVARDRAAAREAYREAATGALAIGDDQVAATTMAGLAAALASADDLVAARIWLDVALALARRASMTLETELFVISNQFEVLRLAGDLDGALASAQRALEVAAAAYGEASEEMASSLSNLVVVRLARGEPQLADEAAGRMLAVSEALGADRPRHAMRLRNAAYVDLELGRFDAAIARGRQVVAILERWYGDDHRAVDEARNNLAVALRQAGDLAGARALFERVQRAYVARYGEASVENGEAQANLAIMDLEAGDLDAAARRAEASLAALAGALGPDHGNLVNALVIAGGIARYRGRLDESRQHLERAVAIADRALGPDHAGTINPRIELANTAVAAGDGARAIEVMTPALALSERAEVAPLVAAEARFTMAQALRAAGREPDRARALASAARSGYAALGEPFAGQVAAIDAWLAE